MKGYFGDIEKLTADNTDFRRVLYTGKHSQLVLMRLCAGEEIGVETHTENDQFFRFESGEGKVIIDGHEYAVKGGDAVIVPVGAKHNVMNTGSGDLKLYTLYAPAHHKDGIVRATKAAAEADGPEFDGVTTE
jgi:mannose-6-phosphate isomerase-like protein (cupin superfamily)